MTRVVFITLVFGAILKSSQEKSSHSCSSYFCKEAVVPLELKQKCVQLMEKPVSCTCHPSTKNWESSCLAFTEANLHINIQDIPSEYLQSESGLVLSVHGTTPAEFDILLERILTYLPWTNITNFHFTSFCGSRRLSQCQGLLDEVKAQHTTLNLSRNYEINKVQTIAMVGSCIGKIDGKFSRVFPALQKINLSQNLVEHISRETFDGLNQLQHLDLHCNRLTSAAWSSLYNLAALKYLDVSFNFDLDITQNTLEKLVNLQVFNTSGNTLKHLSLDTFHRNTKLQILDMSNCSLGNQVFNFTEDPESQSTKWFFHDVTNLRVLSLDQNFISTLPINSFQSNTKLRYLSLKRNSLQHFSSFAQHLNHLVNVDVTGNCFSSNRNWISSLQHTTNLNKTVNQLICQFCCLNLHEAGNAAKLVILSVDFRNNHIFQINMDFLRNVSHLEKVFLSPDAEFNESRQIDISLTLAYPLYIDLQFENPQTKIFISRYAFSTCDFLTLMRVNWDITQSPSLGMVRSKLTFVVTNVKIGNKTYRNMAGVLSDQDISRAVCNFTFYCPEKCVCYTVGFDETVTVNCEGKNLPTFPNVRDFKTPITLHLGNNHIRDLQHTENRNWSVFREIFLDNNRLEFLENFVFGRNLKTLDLRHNRLKHFSSLEHLLTATRYKIMMMLSGNQWQCDCHTQKVRNLLTAQHIVDYHQLTCKSIYSQRLLFLLNATDIDLCPNDEPLRVSIKILLPVFASFVVLLSASFIIYYRCKNYIKLWLFTHRFCLGVITEDDIDADKIYDAFVSYSSLDEDWVCTHLVKRLENEAPFYKLCLHNRDWLAGEWIVEQIFLSVQNSRRTIIVLTENFLNSDWSRMEFMVAYKQAMADRMNRVLVVLPGKVPQTARLGYQLRTFMNLNTYLRWDEPFFWQKLKCAMPRGKRKVELANKVLN